MSVQSYALDGDAQAADEHVNKITTQKFFNFHVHSAGSGNLPLLGHSARVTCVVEVKQTLEHLSTSWEDFSSQNTRTNKQQLEKIVHDIQHKAEL